MCIIIIQTKRTPLMEASERGHTDVVKELLNRGGDPTKTAAVSRQLNYNSRIYILLYGHQLGPHKIS